MTDSIFHKSREWNESTTIENDLCRICLSISDLLIPIFSSEGLEQGLQEKVGKYLPVKISENDCLPQQICYECADTIIAWDMLYTCCLRTDKKLQHLLSSELKIGTKTKSENSDNEALLTTKRRKADNTNIESCASFDQEQKSWDEDVMTIETTHPNSCDKMNSNNFCKQSLTVEKARSRSLDSSTSIACNKVVCDRKQPIRQVKKGHADMKVGEALKCDVCHNIYKTKTNLERHQIKEHLTDQVTCPVCNASFNSKKLDLHLKSIHGVRPEPETEEKFKCKICDKWFKNKYVRNSHVKEAHLSEPVKCKLCDFEGTRAVLRRHKRDVHAEKKFFCSLCPAAFKTLHTLKMHMTSHSDIRCYTCDICGMGFKRLNNVRDHMKCHQQKSNQCQICGNFFARKRYLAIHEKTLHNFYADGVVPEEKGFECEICGAKLKWKKNLLAHMRIHTGEKPYVCKICNKDFVCHGTLRIHMAKHEVCVPNESEHSQSHISAESGSFSYKLEPV